MKKPEVLIILPTFNESENIEKIILSILDERLPVDILVVDDESPDGTSEIVKRIAKKHKNVKLLYKTTDKGFAKAYISGFHYALDNGYWYVIQMDADGSHQPKFLKDLFDAAAKNNYVIGSRWTRGGSVVNWPLKRKILSLGGNLYSRIMLRSSVKDITGGFKMFSTYILSKMNIDDIKVKGYSFQVELMLRARKAGANIIEVPIEFVEREKGYSKMSADIVKEALVYVTKKGFNFKRP